MTVAGSLRRLGRMVNEHDRAVAAAGDLAEHRRDRLDLLVGVLVDFVRLDERVDDEQAAVEVGGKREPVSIADLSRYWFGDYLMLWRPRVVGGKDLSLGMRGDDVGWLRRSLEKVRGLEPTPGRPDVYDEQLARLVEDFQREHRLTVDGIAGMQTQIALDTALADPATPFLLTPPAPGG